jgi:hypothetical protein
MSAWRRMLAIGTLALLTACGGGAGGAGETPATAPATSSEEPTTEPSLEPTGPESPQPTQQKPTIEIANAPIGGDDGSGPRGCASVNWLGSKPIPDGVAIKLGSIHLDPEGIFELDQGSCPGDVRSCAGLEWRGDNPPGCSVGARQVAAVDPNEYVEVRIILAVTVTCERQADCDSLAAEPANSDGSSVFFEPDESFGTPSASPSESPPESPWESPSETASESPPETASESPPGG